MMREFREYYRDLQALNDRRAETVFANPFLSQGIKEILMKKIALFVMLFAVGCFALGCSPATEDAGSIPVDDIATSTDDITEAGGELDTDATGDDTDATGDDTEGDES